MTKNLKPKRKNVMKKVITFLITSAALATLTGCAVVSGRAGESSYVGLAFGEKASSTLAGLNITEETKDGGVLYRGVGVDQAGSQGDSKILETIYNAAIGFISAYSARPVSAPAAQPAAPQPSNCQNCASGNCSDQ